MSVKCSGTYLWFWLVFLGSYCVHAQQLLEQEAFLDNGFLQNPAMTAPFYQATFGGTHRTYWTVFSDPPQAFSFYGQYPFDNMSVGLAYQTDRFGVWQQNLAQATYAYQIDLGRGPSPQLSLGIGAGRLTSKYNLQTIIANHSNDPLLPEIINKNQLFYSSGGIYFTTTDKKNEDRSHLAIGVAGSIVFPRKELFFITPQNTPQQRVIHANALLKYRYVNDDNYFYFEPAVWLDYAYHTKLLSPAFQVQSGLSNLFGLGFRYRFLSDLNLQVIFRTAHFWEYVPITAGVNIIRLTNQTRAGIGYGFFLQFAIDT
ncbi:MAG: type IX secretion system membrane protein PorP/SprF [Bacteroidota bacterium]